MIDCDWNKRMNILTELMQLKPDGKMKKLQREALKYYPLYYTESIRAWMSFRIAFIAAERLNKIEGLI